MAHHAAAAGSSGNEGNPAAGRFHRKREKPVPITTKFKHFQDAIHNNPKIIGGLQKRRFAMVGILEKGTPGPPDGRSLVQIDDTYHGDNGTEGIGVDTHQRMKRTSEKVRTDEQLDIPQPSLVKRWSNRKSVAPSFSDPSDSVTGSEKKPINFRRRAATQVAMKGVKRGSKQNTMSGAVPLAWEDLTQRFVRYVTDHLWSSGPGGEFETCILILDTWNAHLVKARTWAFDEEGKKMNIADLQKSASIKFSNPYDLTEFERSVFFSKQAELNRMGVTELLATVISSLSHDLSEGGLPDTAIELFNELLNGGNERVQDTLYEHLLTHDTEGKLVAHIAKRLEMNMEGMVSAQRNAQFGKDSDDTASDADDCEHAISTVRFIQFLCEGMLFGDISYI
jgi:hypothetical protein